MKKLLAILILSIAALSVISARADERFGKNKVQYKNFDWKYIESPHFDVYFDEGSYYLAKFTALEAEKSLKSIQKTLNYRVDHRIIIVVYDSHNEFQQTNVISMYMPEGVGGVTEMLKNRVVVPFQGNYSQLGHVIHHELGHAVFNHMFYGGTFQSSINTRGGLQLPLWMNEGFCEYESLEGMNAQTDMFMRDLTISEYLPPLERLYGYLAYRGGQTFYAYVADKYGEARVGDLLNRLRINRTLEAAFRSTFSMSYKDFSEQWQKDMKKRYWTDLDIFEMLEDFSTPVTDHEEERNFYNSSPAISPNGEKVAFIADDNGIFKVFIQEIDDKESREELVSSARSQDFEDLNLLTPGISWNPNGTRLAISAKSGGTDAIYIVDVDDGDYEKLDIELNAISSVVWSPDGKKLAYIGSKNQQSDIFSYDLESEDVKNITNDIFSDLYPVWSPDSKQIYFISDRGENIDGNFTKDNTDMWNYDYDRSDVFTVFVESGKIERLTFDPAYEKLSLAVSSDNSKLFYVSDKNGISNIYEMDLATLESVPKTNSISGITQISLSPDDSKLLFTAQNKVGYDIYLIRFPLERNLEIDELPLTKFRKQWMEENELIEETVEIEDESEYENTQELVGYGSFDIDFSDQEVVGSNIDATEADELLAREAIKGEEFTDTAFVVKDYKLKFTPDIVMGNPGYSTYWGFQGVTQMLFSDILGDHQIFLQANLLLDLRNSSFFFAYNYLPDIIDYQFNAYQSAGYVYSYDTPDQTTTSLFRFRNWGAAVFASYPFDMFNRVEWGLSWLNVSKENIYNRDDVLSRSLFVPEARYVHDDVLYGMYGPAKGTRMMVGFKGTPKLNDDGIGFMSVKTDIRHYFHFNDYLHLALRGTAGASFGPNPQNFFLGGIENWFNPDYFQNQLPFNDPVDFAFMEFIMPMRGFSVSEQKGSKFFLTNVELRFPLFRALLAGPVPILFQSIQGALFMDVGGAFDNSFKSVIRNEEGQKIRNDLLMSAGIGVRTNLFGLPVKMDVAWVNEFHTWSKPKYLFSLGYDF